MSNTFRGADERPETHGGLGTYSALESDGGSVTDVAKGQAAVVGDSAKESGRQVAGAAADEMKSVAAETRRQARDLGRDFSDQAQQQAAVQKDKAANGLHSLGTELRTMAAQGGQSGPVTDIAHQAADKVIDLATWLERRDPGSLLDEVRSFARRKPGTFLLGAAAAGIVAGRLTRGAVQASKDEAGSAPSGAGTARNGSDRPSSGTTEWSAANSAYPADATPIADRAAVETAFNTAEPQNTNGYDTTGRSL